LTDALVLIRLRRNAINSMALGVCLEQHETHGIRHRAGVHRLRAVRVRSDRSAAEHGLTRVLGEMVRAFGSSQGAATALDHAVGDYNTTSRTGIPIRRALAAVTIRRALHGERRQQQGVGTDSL